MRRTVWAMLAAGCLAAHGAAAQSPEDDREDRVRDLLSGDRDRVADALDRLPYRDTFPEGYVTSGLVEALIVAHEREEQLRRDASTEPDTYLEMHIALVDAMIATRHPLTTDVLMRLAWAGNGPVDAVLHFGSDVLPRVVELAGSPEATAREATGALYTLQRAVERWSAALGPEIREAMKGVAILHLEGPPVGFASANPTDTWWRGFVFDSAVELAGALEDPELTDIARAAKHPKDRGNRLRQAPGNRPKP